MKHNELFEKLKKDSIKDEELFDCLVSKNFNVIGQAIYKIIDRKYCNENIVNALVQIASMLDGYKVIGPYQMGHLAIAALYLVDNESAIKHFDSIYQNLKDNDKFLIDKFIEGINENNSLQIKRE